VRLRISRIGAIKEAGRAGAEPEVVGNRTRVSINKNKMAPPFREVEFDILYGRGISRAGDVLDLASELGIIDKSGSWFSFGSERIGQGREKARAYLEERPEVLEKITDLVYEKNGIRRPGAVAPNGATAAPVGGLTAVEAAPEASQSKAGGGAGARVAVPEAKTPSAEARAARAGSSH
jgi:recombination protein RecA